LTGRRNITVQQSLIYLTFIFPEEEHLDGVLHGPRGFACLCRLCLSMDTGSVGAGTVAHSSLSPLFIGSTVAEVEYCDRVCLLMEESFVAWFVRGVLGFLMICWGCLVVFAVLMASLLLDDPAPSPPRFSIELLLGF
jgi:hypothetical protein